MANKNDRKVSARPQLPNSPLAEVVCEVRFHGQLSVYESWGSFQHSVRKKFPKLMVPVAELGAAPLLQPLRLVSQDDTEQILLSVNSFAFLTKKYSTFDPFQREFRKLFDAFVDGCRPECLTRAGLRYVNMLPPSLGPSRMKDQLHPCLNLRLSGWPLLPEVDDESPQFILQGKVRGLSTRISLLRPPVAQVLAGAAPGVNLDLDCYTMTPGEDSEVPGFLADAHQVIEEVFFSLLSPEYDKYLKGEKP